MAKEQKAFIHTSTEDEIIDINEQKEIEERIKDGVLMEEEDQTNQILVTDRQPTQFKPIFVEMDDKDEVKRILELLYKNNFKLRMVGERDIMKSEFISILLDKTLRKGLIQKYETILNNFKENTIDFPEVYKAQKFSDGSMEIVQTDIGKYFGGWRRMDKVTKRFEDDNELREMAKQGKSIKFQIKFYGTDRYGKFLSDIRNLLLFAKAVDKALTPLDEEDERTFNLLPTRQKQFIEKVLNQIKGTEKEKILPYKELSGNKIYVDTRLMKGSLMEFLNTSYTGFLSETLSKGGFHDKYFNIENLNEILKCIVGENNYIMLTSEALKTDKFEGKHEIYRIRCIYMDKLGNIGYSEVDASSSFSQEQKSVQSLAMRQAIIKAFPTFKSLRYDNTNKPKGEATEYELFCAIQKQRKEKLTPENFRVGFDSQFNLRIEPIKGEVKADEYNLGLISDMLYITQNDSKSPKNPLLLEDKKVEKKKLSKIERKEESDNLVETEEEEKKNEIDEVKMDEEIKE